MGRKYGWALVAVLFLLPLAHGAVNPQDELAGTLKMFFQKNFVNDWRGLELLPHVQWAPLPPRMLKNCLPDGDCFMREGKELIAGRAFLVVATGARTMVNHIYFRNLTAPVGGAAVVEALKQASLRAELARCPVKGGAGGTNWYRIEGPSPGVLAVQTSCAGKPCEGFVLTPGKQLPPLRPNQLRLYSELCSVPEESRQPVSTMLPVEQLAHMLVALLPKNPAAPLYDWKTLESLPTGIKWKAGGAKKGDLSYRGDPNPWMDQGQADLSGRKFYVLAS